MSTNVTLNGSTYAIPAIGDDNWGADVSAYLIAISTVVLQKSGGTFTLTAETNFGATYGLKTAYYKSQATNPSSAGIVRLGNNESIGWRNFANGADLLLKVNASDVFQFNGSNVLLAGAASIVNADINAAAAIAYSKLSLAGSIVNADISNSAAIAASKLVGTDIATVGTITSGTWSATAIALNKGGTGQTTKAAAFDALQPMSAAGDIIYGGASGTGTRLAKGSDGQVLKLASGVPSWASESLTVSSGLNAYKNANQTLGFGAGREIVFGAEVTDVGGEHSVVTGRFTAAATGYYFFSASLQITYGATASTDIFAYFLKNGTGQLLGTYYTDVTANSKTVTIPISLFIRLTAGDYVSAWVNVSTTDAVCNGTGGTNENTTFNAIFLGA